MTVIGFGSQFGVFTIADAIQAEAAGATLVVAIRKILQRCFKSPVFRIVLEVVPGARIEFN